MDNRIQEITLLLLYLTGWEEDSRKNPGEKLFRSWKGYPFKVLNELAEGNFIIQNRNSKSVVFSPAGKSKAEELKKKYL